MAAMGQRSTSYQLKNRLSPYREGCFPNLGSSPYRVTSSQTRTYNCIAYAANDDERWWWPDEDGISYWPSDVPRVETVEAFIAAYGQLGYVACKDAAHEKGFEKVALYADADGVPTHAARQLPSGTWTSKLGGWQDIEHPTPDDLSGSTGLYGTVSQYLKRPRHEQKERKSKT